ncbi:MAG: protease Do [Betaproteobacteria bacterium]|nr:protease Do [Betaproteobacteria bacterium]
MKRNHWVLALIALAVLGAGAAAYKHDHLSTGEITTAASPAPARTSDVGRGPVDFSAIVQRYGPAVVNISTTGLMSADAAKQLDPDALKQLFGGTPPTAQPEVPVHGEGSGFIVSPDGIVLTNAHVVDGASEVIVKLTDKREFRAKVLGSDPVTDIAVLRIDAKNLPTVHLGRAADVRPGEWVLAIGSPFGFENSVTAGIVSASRRPLPGDGSVPFIQTDAPVNPGNSGGPLFNTAGDVVGINSQIYSATGGFQGISFAIPIDVAARVEQQIVSTGHATHPQLGITIEEVSQPLAQSFGLKEPQGALVASVTPGSAAARAGLQPGDVILRANGQSIVESDDLPELVDKASPGDRLALELWRKDAALNLVATLGQARAIMQTSGTAQALPDSLGLVVRPLDRDEQREAKVDAGVIVERAGGRAALAGIQPGDIVLAVNGVAVRSADALRLTLGRLNGTAALLVQRGDTRVFVPVPVG